MLGDNFAREKKQTKEQISDLLHVLKVNSEIKRMTSINHLQNFKNKSLTMKTQSSSGDCRLRI